MGALSYHSFAKVALALLLALLVAALAPVQLGGRAAFVIIRGSSMEPLYKSGDLVIARAASDYAVGDIVTYLHPSLGPVIHRIIGREDERWVLQGDNNDFIDGYRPVDAELIGRSALHIPAVGTALIFLRQSPLLTTILLGGSALAMTLATDQRRRQFVRRKARAEAPRAAAATSAGRETLVLALGLLSIASLVLAGFALSRPTQVVVAEELSYKQRGAFGYTAAAPPGIYDAPAVRAGEPVFRSLAERVRFSFAYTLEADEPVVATGSYGMVAELSLQNGWKRTIELLPERPFNGGSFESSADLDLAEVEALIERLQEQTGLQHQQFYLAVVPSVKIAGTLDGQLLRESFAPRLEFLLDPVAISVLRGDEADPLQPVQGSAIQRERSQRNTIGVLGLRLDVERARTLGLAGFLVGALGAVVAAAPLVSMLRGSEHARIRLRYGALIVEGADVAEAAGARTVALGSIDDLARLAERHGSLIIAEGSGAARRYALYESGLAYVYAPDREGAPVRQELVALPHAAEGWLERHGKAAPPVASELAGWQARFVEALGERGVVAEACQMAGVGLAEAYRERSSHPGFALAWDEARAQVRRRIRDEGVLQ